MTIADIREALAAAAELVVPATPYVTDQVNTPQAVMRGEEIFYDDSFDGEARYLFTITVYVTREARSGQEQLDALREPSGETSLKYALESDVALKAVVQTLRVSRASPIGQTVVGETLYLACDFDIEIVSL